MPSMCMAYKMLRGRMLTFICVLITFPPAVKMQLLWDQWYSGPLFELKTGHAVVCSVYCSVLNATPHSRTSGKIRPFVSLLKPEAVCSCWGFICESLATIRARMVLKMSDRGFGFESRLLKTFSGSCIRLSLGGRRRDWCTLAWLE